MAGKSAAKFLSEETVIQRGTTKKKKKKSWNLYLLEHQTIQLFFIVPRTYFSLPSFKAIVGLIKWEYSSNKGGNFSSSSLAKLSLMRS